MTSRGAPEIEISVVLPCFNEAESLESLTGELYAVLRALGRSFEIIFVNDASIDRSPEVLRRLERRYPELVSVHHVVNCGESAAQAIGFQRAWGEIVITMDSDGQNDPRDLPRLLDAIDDMDAVCGVRRRREDTWVKRISSRVANGFRNAITGDRVRDAGCTYRALRRMRKWGSSSPEMESIFSSRSRSRWTCARRISSWSAARPGESRYPSCRSTGFTTTWSGSRTRSRRECWAGRSW